MSGPSSCFRQRLPLRAHEGGVTPDHHPIGSMDVCRWIRFSKRSPMSLLASLASWTLPLLPGPAPQATPVPHPGFARLPPPLLQVVDAGPYTALASDGGWVLVYQDESSLDLNGDGDTLDHVYAVHDLAGGTTTNLGLAHRLNEPVVLGGGRALLLVPEFEQGADLHGDGDIGDRVWFAVDLASGSSMSSALAGSTGGGVAVGSVLMYRWAVLPVLEFAQGQSDLDASGTIAGSVLYSWDLVAATSPTS